MRSCQRVHVLNLSLCPKPQNFRAFSHWHKLQLMRGRGAKLTRDVTVSLLPHFSPEVLEKMWNLVVSVQLSQQEEVTGIGLIEEKLASPSCQVVLMVCESC